MGAFFLFQKNADIDLEAVKKCFSEKGFDRPTIRHFGLYTLWLYKKTLIDLENCVDTDEGSIYSVGTVIYKQHDYHESLKNILYDALNERLDFGELIGSFAIFIKTKKKLYYLTDQAGTQNIFFNKDKTVISSCFLAVILASMVPLKLNKLAITEILLTGNLVGPDTTLQEITRFLVSDPENFDGIQLLNPPVTDTPHFCKASYNDCLNEQIEVLENYFINIKNFANRYGVSSGLTSGLDSRLLLILITKHLENYQFFSTWQKIKGDDWLISEKVAKATGQELISPPITDPLNMDKNQALETLHQSYIFFDGLIRTYHLWIEEISTRSYREKLLNDKRISLSGIGGEQYRNQERMILKKWDFMTWLQYELVYRYSGNCFNNKREKEHFLDYIGTKIKKRLKIQNKKYIDHLTIKRYFNEIYNPANRTTRMNIENQIAFFLCPYAEYNVSRAAYKIIPHLNTYMKFEADMVKNLSPKIAAIKTHYGCNLLEGEPLSLKLLTYLKELFPSSIFYRLYRKRKPPSHFYYQYENKFSFVKDNTRLLLDLNLPIDIDKLKKNSLLNPLIISMGYFIYILGNKLRL